MEAIMVSILKLYRDSGKENGNYDSMLGYQEAWAVLGGVVGLQGLRV